MKISSNSRLPGIIVLGGHVQGLGILRILGRDNIPGVVVDSTRKNLARHSKFCRSFFCVKDDDLLTFLLHSSNVKAFHNWCIFPTNDYHVRLLSYNKEKLSKYYSITVDSWDVVEKFYNKKNTYQLALSLKIPIPETWYPESKYDLIHNKISFPCIIKPAIMHDFYKKVKKKVFICSNYEELTSQYEKALTIIPKEEVIIQEIIPGPSKNQYSACFLFLNGQSYISLTACRMRQHPIDFGSATTYAEAVDIPEIRVYAERLLKVSRYNGLCEVEFKKDARDGCYKFLEVNTRTWKWHSIANKTGTPFLKAYFNYLNGLGIKSHSGFKIASFTHFATDFPIRMQLLLKGYKYWNRKVRPCEHAVWSREDLKPWVYEKLYLIHFINDR